MGDIIEQRRRHYSGLDADKASIPAGGLSVMDRFFATDTKVDYFWDSVAWIIIPLDVIVAGMIKTDAVETAKIKNLHVTKGKAELGFGRYVPRHAAAVDKAIGDFTTNFAWHVDGLDLSGILPVGTTAVILMVSVAADTAGTLFRVQRNAADYERGHEVILDVANGDIDGQLTVPVDANRLLDYKASNVIWATLDVTVVGYYI